MFWGDVQPNPNWELYVSMPTRLFFRALIGNLYATSSGENEQDPGGKFREISRVEKTSPAAFPQE